MMRAAALSGFGPPEVLRETDVEEPHAGSGQVRVRVRAAGVLPFDVRVRGGWTPPFIKREFPLVLGNEFAGVVDETGEGVTSFTAGEEVLGYGVLGGYAEYVVVPAEQLVRKPAAMPWEVAAGFSGNGQGAHMALSTTGVHEGDTVLVNAAAGGFGTFSVQLALAWGAGTVIGTASERNHDHLRALGAVPVTYGEGLVERVRAVAPDGVDAALDAAGPEALRASVELVKDRDRVVTMVATEEAAELGLRDVGGARSAERLAELVELYERGKVTVHLREVYPLERAADAHRDVESGHGRGKVVLSIA
ncbi:NADP-dependent oxidoreductase [Streptomyces sp. TRM 70351]|uniref:NADP-dependent oxidoreductase n=1 Tax=Streptomyces sp. TRM 70351 TaxID=3116552 RepID=UPI002E7B9862|nr:NADP-dependent oxidoreductase [Streptomyces sp. TRM 70351]MEE1929395.1 NADP-dependent oxidoreductase [Streptomyces sp. TRM 70351]